MCLERRTQPGSLDPELTTYAGDGGLGSLDPSCPMRSAFLLLLLSRIGRADEAAVDANGAQSAPESSFVLRDENALPIATEAKWTAFDRRCQTALKKALAEAGSETMPKLYPDPLTDVSVEPRAAPDDVRVVYVILAARESAPLSVSRLVRALYHPTHLFLVHVDLKTNATAHEALTTFAASRPNVHVLKTRRLVQWAGFTAVLALLDALISFVDRLDFDFVVPLSDGELSLRNNEEMVLFLRRFKGRSMVQVLSALLRQAGCLQHSRCSPPLPAPPPHRRPTAASTAASSAVRVVASTTTPLPPRYRAIAYQPHPTRVSGRTARALE